MNKEVSKYKNNVIASKKKHIYSRLMDYFSLFVVTYLLFTIFYSIGARLPVVNSISTELKNKSGEVAEYIDSTHLQRLNEDHSSLLSIDEGAKQYVLNVCKTSAYIHDLTFQIKNSEGIYEEKTINENETFAYNASEYNLDTLSYYFKKFKKEDSSLNTYIYQEVDYKDDIDTYLYLKIMNLDETKYVSSSDSNLLAKGNGISRFTVLNLEETNNLLRYYKEDRIDTSTYDRVFLSFISACKYGIKEVENKSSTYLNLLSSYQNTYQSLTLAIFIIYLVSYVVSYLLLLFIMRLVSKEWITLGQKVMGLAMSDYEEMEPGSLNLVIYNVINFILFISSLSIAFYFTGMLGIFTLTIVPGLTLFTLFVPLLILNLISLFMPLFTKNHHNLSTLLSRLIVKDTKDFDGPVDIIESEEDGREKTEDRSNI